MFKVDHQIYDWAVNGGMPGYDPERINLDKDNPLRQINPASLDLRLSNRVRKLRQSANYTFLDYEDPDASAKVWEEPTVFDVLELYPGELVLLSSIERTIIPPDWIAFLFLKSSTGRHGVEHLHAGFGDCSFDGTWTFEICNLARNIVWRIRPGTRMVQLCFSDCDDLPTNLYSEVGRYQKQHEPTAFRSQRLAGAKTTL